MACILAACGPGGPALDLQLTVLEKDLALRGSAAQPGTAPAGIGAFRLCLQTPDGRTETCQDFTDLNSGSYRLQGLPTGKGWVVSFQGYRIEDQTAIWCGRARQVEISDKHTTSVRMLLTRCGDVTLTVQQPTIARTFHTASARQDGRVLVVGGFDAQASSAQCDKPCTALMATNRVEIYNHVDGTFDEAGSSLSHARGAHAARTLPDGRMLVAGGCELASLQSDFSDPDRPGSPLRCLEPGQAAVTAELYDPAGGSLSEVSIPASVFATGVAVGDDELLLVGGEDEAGIPTRRLTRVWVEGDQVMAQPLEQALIEARRSPAAVVFSSPGTEPVEILVIGGAGADDRDEPGNFAERVIFQDGSFASQVPRFIEEMYGAGLPVMHTAAARVGSGQVLVAGGMYPSRFLSQDTPFFPEPLTLSASLDLRTERLTLLDEQTEMLKPRALHTATVTDRFGHVLILGGMTSRQPMAALHMEVSAGIEWWDDQANYFSLRWVEGAPAEMEVARAGHTATLLEDGNVLIVGGTDGETLHAHSELFNPAATSLEEEGLPPL
jgi:hypothetical protein